MNYGQFLNRKAQHGADTGFEPIHLPDWLMDFQRHLVDFAVRKGRAAILADCGLGKTPMQLMYAWNVVEKTSKPVLILTPLAVSHQTVREAGKFDIAACRSVDGTYTEKIVVTNYERLHYFNPKEFAGVVCDESSILKHFDGSRKAEITEFMRQVPYRLLCTATAAPNDYFELGTSSEALGYLGYRDMLSMFFKQESKKDHHGWGRSTHRFRGHAVQPFWRWVCSWARACRKPSDLGYDDDRFVLPPMTEHEHLIENSTPREGLLFSVPARGMKEEREERRVTLRERCEKAAELAHGDNPCVVWCHLNPEGDLIEKLVPDAVQVSGAMSDEQKEERLLAFQNGDVRVLVTKPKIGCFGLNWQHCHDVVTFPSHSWEQYYQSVRRCWRFGQQNAVDVHIVTTAGEHDVMRNLKRKANQADAMFASLVEHMGEAMHIDGGLHFEKEQELPQWLTPALLTK